MHKHKAIKQERCPVGRSPAPLRPGSAAGATGSASARPRGGGSGASSGRPLCYGLELDPLKVFNGTA